MGSRTGRLACVLMLALTGGASAGEPKTTWKIRGQLPVNLEALLDNDAIADAQDRADGNFDCPDHAAHIPGSTFPAENLPSTGSVFSFDGVHFLFPSKERGDFNNVACAGQRLELPPGRYRALHVVGASENGSFKATLALAYREGPAEAELALSDWCQKPAPGDKTAFEADARYTYSSDRGRVVREAIQPRLWRQTIRLDQGKTLEALSLPYNRRMHLFAASLTAVAWDKDQQAYANDTAEVYASLTKRLPLSVDALRAKLAKLAAQLDHHAATGPHTRQAGWLRTQAAYAEHQLSGGRRPSPGVLRRVNREIRTLGADLAALLAGNDPFPARRGCFLRSYRSELDGSLQSYSLAVPRDYTGDKPFPLILSLHGHGWYRPFQGHPQQSVQGVLIAAPHGRGSIDYMLAAEADVLAVLDDVCRDYKVDPHRVYLEGHSMGGTGSWQLGVHYPHRFAAILPVCGNADGQAWKVWLPKGARKPEPLPPRFQALRDHLLAATDPVSYAGNLLNLPAFAAHGARDDVVPVENSRNMAAALKKLACPITYTEFPWVRHWGFPRAFYDKRWDWMMAQRRGLPRRVRYKTASLRHGGAYWVRIDRFVEPLAFAEIDAQFHSHNQFTVTTRNVAAFTLDLHRSPGDPMGAVQLAIDGTKVDAGGPAPRFVRSRRGKWAAGRLPRGLAKKAGLEGPVGDVFLASFVLVRGTTSEDPWERQVIRRQLEARAHDWQRLYNCRPRVKDDTAVTEDDIALHHLVLYGGPDANAVTKRVARKLPIRIERDRIRVGRRAFAGRDVGVTLCYPNPLNPERYVAVFAGLSPEAMDQVNNRFGNWFGWGPYDNYGWFDYAVFDGRTRSPETFLAVGFFDQAWELDDRTQFLGDEALRLSRQPRRVPRLKSLPEAPPDTLRLSDLSPTLIDQHKGTVGFDRSFQGNKLMLGARSFERGLGVRAPSIVEYRLDGKYAWFRATVGIDLEGATAVSRARARGEYVQFLVHGDGRRLYSSEWLQWNSRPVDIEVELEGAKVLRLEVDCSASRWLVGSADWGDARVSTR